ncbi:kinase-like domain-containing protein [Crucibulum laeve]|uniref:Kinase-like domain-containing protein n=1 Tax=Crucibulum laeve TaxID=68775 RepID=A0A5C3LU72_9AGAR|nr:kinase-like domain-containing protein [Crucibulum laeve]
MVLPCIQGVALVPRQQSYYPNWGSSELIGLYRGEKVSLKSQMLHESLSGSPYTVSPGASLSRLVNDLKGVMRINHPYVISVIGVDLETSPGMPYLVSPWMESGTILQYRRVNGASNINIEKRMTELAQAVCYLHSQNIIHGAIGGSTVFIQLDGTACLGDFNLSDFITPNLLAEGTVYSDERTPRLDLYEFACLCFELYTGDAPFTTLHRELMRITRAIPTRPRHYEDSEVAIPDDIWTILENCWDTSKQWSSTDMIEDLGALNQKWNTSIWNDLVPHLAQWVFDDNAKPLCWMEVSSSSNQTYISRSVSDLCVRERRLAASLFFPPDYGLDALDLVLLLIHQIMNSIPLSRRFVQQALTADPSFLHPKSENELGSLLSTAILRPLKSMSKSNIAPKIIVIDSLDLWDHLVIGNDRHTSANSWISTDLLARMIAQLSEHLRQERLPLKIFVISGKRIHRNVKREIPRIETYTHTLYVHSHGTLNSSENVWSQLHRICDQKEYEPVSSLLNAHDKITSQVKDWCNNKCLQRICWIKHPSLMYGQPSGIAYTIATQCRSTNSLAAYLTCSSRQLGNSSLFSMLALELGNSLECIKSRMENITYDEMESLDSKDNQDFFLES